MRGFKHSYSINGDTATVLGERRNGAKFEFTISSCDLPQVLEHRWCLCSYSHWSKGYIRGNVNGKYLYLHHLIMGNPKKGEEVDHIDRNTLNNTRKNLRIVSSSKNHINRKITNRHGFPGLEYMPERRGANPYMPNPWYVRIRIKDPTATTMNTGGSEKTRLLSLGVFPSKELAIEARRRAEERYFGLIAH
jgi:hypothetical protein